MAEMGEISGHDRTIHVLNRLAFGPRPGDFQQVASLGAEQYIQQQLHPESIPVAGELDDRIAELSTLQMSPGRLFAKYWLPVAKAKGDMEARKAALLHALEVVREAVQARLIRALYGPRRLQEVMTAFWFNHFNVFAGKGLCIVWTGSFEEVAIRPHTMGKFRDLLGATARHPAMLFYLDNWQNTAPDSPGAKGRFQGINENYARELMELHTLGVNGGYTQNDVIALAHILTGWGLPRPRRALDPDERPRLSFGRFMSLRRQFSPGAGAGFYFDPSRHDFADQVLLQRTIKGGGEEEVERALDLLASHPATARHISSQLAQYFVADEPPPELVDRMASRYAETDGEIREVLAAMFSSPEFWDRANFRAKFKTPQEYVISSVRAADSQVVNFRPMAGMMMLLGMPLYGCQTPNGFADTREAWLNPDAMMARLSFATALGRGNLRLDRPVSVPDASGQMSRENRGYFNRAGRATVKLDGGAADAEAMSAGGTMLDSVELVSVLGDSFSQKTLSVAEGAPPNLRAAVILGSPEFMFR